MSDHTAHTLLPVLLDGTAMALERYPASVFHA